MRAGAAGVRLGSQSFASLALRVKTYSAMSAFNLYVYICIGVCFVSTRISSARSVDLDGGLEIQLKIFIAKGETVSEQYTTFIRNY